MKKSVYAWSILLTLAVGMLAGFLIRKLEGIPGLADAKYFCVAVRPREDNEKLVAALREIICQG